VNSKGNIFHIHQYSTLVQDFRKKLEKAQEVYEIREKEVAEMEHQRDKYSDDEIDQARKNLREDKANLKAQEDIIDNVRRWYFEVIKKI